MLESQIIQGNALNIPLPDGSVDLVFGSPPYPDKGERSGVGLERRKYRDWANWVVDVTREALRVCRGPIGWVVNGAIQKSAYRPGVEHLIVALDDAGICLERPCIWTKNAPPNRLDWFSNCWESIVWAKHPGPVPYFDWQAIAEPPKYTKGGDFQQRDSKGQRRKGGKYPNTKLVRPTDVLHVGEAEECGIGDVFRVTVGGGHLGHPLAHQGIAPFPEKLVEPFVKALCPPGGLVCDPFGGSGTTHAVALRLGRRCVSMDIRQDQVDLAIRRVGPDDGLFRQRAEHD